jgi:hypothetical protein
LQSGELNTDLYRKPTDRVQYLLPNSCHPNHIFKSVTYSLALRILRICSKKSDLEKRLEELNSMLISRNYNKNIVKNAITHVKTLDGQTHLQKMPKKTNVGIVLALTYTPKLPSVPQIVKKHWRTLARDPNMRKIFPAPPKVAYKQFQTSKVFYAEQFYQKIHTQKGN